MAQQFDPGMPQTHIPIPERETYYPAWGPNFSQHLQLVLRDGEGKSYTKPDGNPVRVEDVLAERRWAIDYETGSFLDARDFREAYTNWIMMVCTPQREVIPMRAVNPHFEPTLEPIPNVDDFVLHRAEGGRLDWGDQHARVFKPQQSIDPKLLGTIVSEAKAAGMREATEINDRQDREEAAAVAPPASERFPQESPPQRRGRGRPRKNPVPQTPAPE